MGLPPGRAAAGPASDSQHVPHNGTLHGTRKSNAVPAGYRRAHPTQGQGWDGAALAPGPPASVCVVASRRRHSLTCRGLLPCDSAAFPLWGQRNLGLTKERAGWQREVVVGQCRAVKASARCLLHPRYFGAGMWGRMCVLLCWLKTVPSPHDKHARGHGIGPRSLTVPPSLDASGEAEQHCRDRRTRTHPVITGSRPPGKPVPQASTGAAPAWAQVFFVNQPWYVLNIQDGQTGASTEIL